MIDEELYQQAADELNSGNRKASIWARACALASDDHDEARYLYTNLRVEELIRERDGDNTPGNSADETKHDTTLALEPVDAALLDDDGLDLDDTLETLYTESTSRFQSSPEEVDAEPEDDTLAFLSDKELAELETEANESRIAKDADTDTEGLADELWSIEDTEHDTTLSSLAASISAENTQGNNELSDTETTLFDNFDESSTTVEDSVADFEPDELAEFQASMAETEEAHHQAEQHQDPATSAPVAQDPVQKNNEQLQEILEGVKTDPTTDTPVLEVSELVQTGEFIDHEAADTQQTANHDLDWLDDTLPPSNLPAHATAEYEHPDDADSLEQEFERQAQDLPGQQSDVVAHDDTVVVDVDTSVPEDQTPPEVSAAARVASGAAASGAAAAAAYRASSTMSQIARPPTPFTPKPVAPAPKAAPELPINLSRGGNGNHYSVFKRNQQIQVVKDGVSWSALIATIPFLLYRHLFGTAFVYAVMAVITIVGLGLSGLSWLDQGETASDLIKASTAGFALLAVIGLFYLPFRYANNWRSSKLERRGFEMVAWVEESNPGRAISRARRASALD